VLHHEVWKMSPVEQYFVGFSAVLSGGLFLVVLVCVLLIWWDRRR
jgi:hypothetical protein